MRAWKLYPSAIAADECIRFRKACQDSSEFERATVGTGDDNREDRRIRKGRVCWPLKSGQDPILDSLLGIMADANKSFGFDLDPQETEFQTARYDSDSGGDYYSRHQDAHIANDIEQPSARKLSAVLQLSQSWDYSGGQLRFYHVNPPSASALRKIGSVIVFPSYVVHSLEPLASGSRFSLVAWQHGPPFK